VVIQAGPAEVDGRSHRSGIRGDRTVVYPMPRFSMKNSSISRLPKMDKTELLDLHAARIGDYLDQKLRPEKGRPIHHLMMKQVRRWGAPAPGKAGAAGRFPSSRVLRFGKRWRSQRVIAAGGRPSPAPTTRARTTGERTASSFGGPALLPFDPGDKAPPFFQPGNVRIEIAGRNNRRAATTTLIVSDHEAYCGMVSPLQGVQWSPFPVQHCISTISAASLS